jgi:hypothetical protein
MIGARRDRDLAGDPETVPHEAHIYLSRPVRGGLLDDSAEALRLRPPFHEFLEVLVFGAAVP